MATKKSTPAKKPAAKIVNPAEAAKTDVPDVIVSDEFHAPIAERTGGVKGGNRRVMQYVLMVVLLIIAATLYVWLTHDKPVE